MVALKKKSAGILMYLRANEVHAWDFRLRYLQDAPDSGIQAVTVFNDFSRCV